MDLMTTVVFCKEKGILIILGRSFSGRLEGKRSFEISRLR
jgi:hypothetical protein